MGQIACCMFPPPFTASPRAHTHNLAKHEPDMVGGREGGRDGWTEVRRDCGTASSAFKFDISIWLSLVDEYTTP